MHVFIVRYLQLEGSQQFIVTLRNSLARRREDQLLDWKQLGFIFFKADTLKFLDMKNEIVDVDIVVGIKKGPRLRQVVKKRGYHGRRKKVHQIHDLSFRERTPKAESFKN
jgi:hypothetical protein